MDATEVFSKITYLKEGMEKLLTQGPAVSSEDIKALLEATEAKASPTINFNPEGVARAILPELLAKVPAFDAAQVAKQLGPLLTAGLPTPATLKQASEEAAAKINQEFARQEQRTLGFLDYLDERLTVMKEQVDKTVKGVPATVGLDAFYDKRLLLLVLGMPAICFITLIIYSSFFRVPKAQYEQLQAQSALLQQERDRMTDASMFYSGQINDYKRKFPKAAGYFRDYHPAPAAQSAELAAQ